MNNPKKATVYLAASFYVRCPYCEEELVNNENGSFIWSDFHFDGQPNVGCLNCGRKPVNPTNAPKRVSTYTDQKHW